MAATPALPAPSRAPISRWALALASSLLLLLGLDLALLRPIAGAPLPPQASVSLPAEIGGLPPARLLRDTRRIAPSTAAQGPSLASFRTIGQSHRKELP